MQKKESKQKNWQKHLMRETALALLLMVCGHGLIGCSTNSIKLKADCPQPIAVPKSITESDFPEVQSLSEEVQTYLSEATEWLKSVQ